MSRCLVVAIIAFAFLLINASALKLTVIQWSGTGCDSTSPVNMLTVDSGACVTTQQATVKITDNGANITYGYGCNAGCSTCLINGSAPYNACALISSPLGDFNATVVKTRFPAYTTTQYYTNRTAADFSTCANPQSNSDITLQSGVCYQERKTGIYQQFVALDSNPFTFGFNRNCTDNTCNTCFISALYQGVQKCARISDLASGDTDFGYINQITDGTPAPTASTSPSPTPTTTASANALVMSAVMMMTLCGLLCVLPL